VANLGGSASSEIDASLEQVWGVVEDVLRAPDWQDGLLSMDALETDDQGRATLVEAENDAKVRTVRSIVRFSYDGPTRLNWHQEKGEMKSVVGSWELEDLSDGRTRATYRLEVELGRMLSMVIRGPLVDVLRGQLVSARAEELKQHVEGA